MDKRIVTCNICLEEINIDDTWFVTDKKYYECKNTKLCFDTKNKKFPKPIEVKEEVKEEINEIVGNESDNTNHTILNQIIDTLFPSIHLYSKLKSD